MIRNIRTVLALLTLSVSTYIITPIAHAQVQFQPLSGSLPVIGGTNGWPALPVVLNGLLGMSVGLAAILAVIMLAVGGFKYMTSESVFNMGNAKEQIANAIVGLLIVLAAVVVLNMINPQLTSLNLFQSNPQNYTSF